MAPCSELTKKGLPCPLQALAGKSLCHIHHKSAELEETRRKEEAERAARGVKLCIGGGDQKCSYKAELPLDSDKSTCDACIKKIRERLLANKAKRDAATAERNKAKANKGVKECIACHQERPDADFVTERRAKGGGEPVSNRCKSCRERAKEVKAVAVAGSQKREQEQARRREEAKKAEAAGKRTCSRHGSVTRGCWVVLPDGYEGTTCQPCIKLREEYRAYKQAQREREREPEKPEDESAGEEETVHNSEEVEDGEIVDEEEAAPDARKPGMCLAIVRSSGKPCPNKAADNSQYCKKHELDGQLAAIIERGGRFCANVYRGKDRCQKELPPDCKFKKCEPCRNAAKESDDKLIAAKREKAAAEIAALRELGVTKKMCMNPKCCGIKDPSDFAFEETSERAGWCSECREKRQVYVAKLPGGKRTRTEADMERAREYEKTPARKASKLARKEANPERWAQYSKDSRARRRAADPEGYLAKAAADQARHRNRARVISFEGEEQPESRTAEDLIKEMDSCCFFCGDEHSDQKPLGVHRLDLSLGWTADNCVPTCTNCWEMKKKVDARTFVERCVYIQEVKEGGVRSDFPSELFGNHHRAGQFAVYRSVAKERGRPFELLDYQFNGIVQEPCYICGKKNIEGVHTNGVDRVDNKQGYTLLNSRAACGDCNYMKSHLQLEVFYKQVSKVASRAQITLAYIPEDTVRSTFVCG